LKFEYLNKVENAGNFKFNSFFGDSGWERALPSTIYLDPPQLIMMSFNSSKNVLGGEMFETPLRSYQTK
jgi:hypothetical protein